MRRNVLFLCTGNSARSQMAEAFLRQYGSESFNAYSAGLEPKGLNPYTIRAMKERGMDLSSHSSKSVNEFLGKSLIHIVISVCDHADQNCPAVWPGVVERLHWSFEDPAAFQGTDEEKLDKFREIRDAIERKVQQWLQDQKTLRTSTY